MNSQRPAIAPSRSWVALAILFAVAVFNFLDRTLISILQIPLKAELHLSDTQLGILVGAAFGLVYTLFGLPMGGLADRTSRKGVLTGALAVWTLLTATTSLARTFATLVVCRMGVALGEAACAPISHSLISDLFPIQRRGSAVAVWSAAVPLGVVLGFLIGGTLNASLGWRHSFLFIGLLGLLLIPIVAFGLKEPPRGAMEAQTATHVRPPLSEILSLMWRTRSFRLILVAAAFHLLTTHSVGAFAPQFYARVFKMPLAQIGMTMALLSGVGGLFGMFVGGAIGDRLARRDRRWQLWLSAATIGICVPLSLAQYWSASAGVAIAIGLVTSLLGGVWFAPMIALTQSLMPPAARTFTGAFYVSFVNVFSMTIGPVATGRMSDVFTANPAIGHDALRYALTAIQIGSAISIFFFLAAAKTVRADLAAPDAAAAANDQVVGSGKTDAPLAQGDAAVSL